MKVKLLERKTMKTCARGKSANGYGIKCAKSQGDKKYHIGNLLNVEEWKSDGFPEVVSIFACHLEMFVPFLLYQRIILDCHRIPHVVFLEKKRIKKKSQNCMPIMTF